MVPTVRVEVADPVMCDPNRMGQCPPFWAVRSPARLVWLGMLVLVTVATGCRPDASNNDPKAGPNPTAGADRVVTGRVVDESGEPIPEARVRIKGESRYEITNARGEFRYACRAGTTSNETLTAAHPDFFIRGIRQPSLDATAPPVEIRLRRLPDSDNDAYAWVDPRPDNNAVDRCGNCHPQIFAEWSQDGHAQAAANPRFRNLYQGDNWHGAANQGWSLQADYPGGESICWSCHVPSVDKLGMPAVDLPSPHSVPGLGVHCDYCHKIRALESGTWGLMHGRFAVRLARPSERQLFFGPLDDVDRDEDAYSPLQHQSEFCATCHEGTLFGVHVYRTYSEWLQSPAKQQGKQCQDCHMQPTGMLTNVAPGAGGIDRDPQQLASHAFLRGGREGADRAEQLRKVLLWKVDYRREQRDWKVEIDLTLNGVGHHFPTGYIDRQLILDIRATDAEHHSVELRQGDRLPDAVGAPLAGRAGYLFARLLRDEQNQLPAPFWRHVDIERDQSLSPEQTWRGSYLFPAETRYLEVSLSYRRFWQTVREAKAWPDDTVLVRQMSVDLQTESN